MNPRYTRLKLKLLLMVVAGTLAAAALGLFLLEFVVDGLLQQPFAKAFLWFAQRLFGQSERRPWRRTTNTSAPTSRSTSISRWC